MNNWKCKFGGKIHFGIKLYWKDRQSAYVDNFFSIVDNYYTQLIPIKGRVYSLLERWGLSELHPIGIKAYRHNTVAIIHYTQWYYKYHWWV